MDLSEALEKITELTSELAVKDAKLKDVTDNFSGYRKTAEAEKEELTKKAEGATKDFETFKGDIEKKTAEQIKTSREAKLKELSKGDDKIIAQIEEKYGILNMPETTEAEVAARLEMARTIALGSDPTPSAHDAAGGGNGMGGTDISGEDKMSDAAAGAHARMFGTPTKK